MSVLAAVVVGPGAAAAYGPQCGGARKRKDVVQDDQEPAADGRGCDEGGFATRLLLEPPPPSAHGLFVLETVKEDDGDDGGGGDGGQERSSIGAVSDGDEEDGEEVNSRGSPARRKKGALACMDALDDALPIKRGLSNFFSGKSRSFANLQDAAAAVTSARDLAKPENPFNKRRRVLRCSSIRRVASTPLAALPPFMPPAAAADGAGESSG